MAQVFSRPGPGPDMWTCGHCDTRNFNDMTGCRICDNPREDAPDAPDAGSVTNVAGGRIAGNVTQIGEGAPGSTVTNICDGDVSGSVFQAGQVDGGVHFH